MGYYHHELEQYPSYISYFEFRSGNLDVDDRWYCIACEENFDEEELDEDCPTLDEWYPFFRSGSLVDLLREFDAHVEEYHC
jgi:hypothetical protein